MNAKEIACLMKKHQLRPTPQRISVYQYLYEHRVHASADQIYQALSEEYPSFSKTTIYNSINALEQSGFIHSLSIDSSTKRYDVALEEHGHFRCNRCGRIFDFPLEDCCFLKLPALKDFEILQEDVFIYGICRECKAQARSE